MLDKEYCQGVTDGYQLIVNQYRAINNPPYRRGVEDGKFLRDNFSGRIANTYGYVTLESLIGALKEKHDSMQVL